MEYRTIVTLWRRDNDTLQNIQKTLNRSPKKSHFGAYALLAWYCWYVKRWILILLKHHLQSFSYKHDVQNKLGKKLELTVKSLTDCKICHEITI